MNASEHDFVLECRGVSHWFGAKKVLFDVNLQVPRGQFMSLVGPSGCGKSTLLRAILGTHPPCSGEILMNGEAVSRPGRDRGIVYQRYSLFPFLTARQNVAFGLVLDRTNLLFRFFRQFAWRSMRREYLEEADQMLARVGLADARNQYPVQLSGGMCQRVAIAQALVMKPQILLLDEPFGALDESTREDSQQLLRELHDENIAAKEAGEKPPHTILIVTHELNEAIYVADRVVGLTQYWDWQDAGQASPPGATINYDDVASSFLPGEERNYDTFVKQRTEIRDVVFNPDCRPKRGEYLRFWQEMKAP